MISGMVLRYMFLDGGFIIIGGWVVGDEGL